jgi:hypothetical protein
MPYLDVAVRQALNLATSCPSEEDIAAAAASRGLVLRDGQLLPMPAKTTRKASAGAAGAP